MTGLVALVAVAFGWFLHAWFQRYERGTRDLRNLYKRDKEHTLGFANQFPSYREWRNTAPRSLP